MSSRYLKEKDIKGVRIKGNKILGTNGATIMPELCAALGNAVGILQEGGRVGVGCCDTPSAEAMKRAFIAGAQSSGAQVLDFGETMESEAAFAISALGLGVSAYIRGMSESVISFMGHGATPLSSEKIQRIERIIREDRFNRCCWNEYKRVADTSGVRLLYIRELYSAAPSGLSGMAVRPLCDNRQGENLFRDTLYNLGCNVEKGDSFKLSDDGLTLTIEGEDVGIIEPERVKTIYCGTEFLRHNDIVIPKDAPQEIEMLANKYGRRVYRVGNVDSKARAEVNVARAQYRMHDGILVAIRLISYLRQSNLTMKDLDLMF